MIAIPSETYGLAIRELVPYAAYGFAAQMVGGCLGMAYGVCLTTILLLTGDPLPAISATVHASELLPTAASGFSHIQFKNVDRKLVLRLLPAGVLGGALGAFVLTSISCAFLKPVVSVYLALMGTVILIRAFRPATGTGISPTPSKLVPMGLTGGFLDAVGGGGWGVFVTSSLMASGSAPRYVVGSVNLCKFFVTLAASAVFFATIGIPRTTAVVGLLIGGIIAAPFAAWMCGRVPRRPMMVLVGLLVIAVSVRTFVRFLG